MVIWKLRASLPSVFVNAPRSLKTNQMMRAGSGPRMPPRCAKDAHWLSSAWDSGAAAAGVGACSVIDLPFGLRVIAGQQWCGARARCQPQGGAAIKRTHKLVPDTARWQGQHGVLTRYNWQSTQKSAKNVWAEDPEGEGAAWFPNAALRFSG